MKAYFKTTTKFNETTTNLTRTINMAITITKINDFGIMTPNWITPIDILFQFQR